MNTAARGKRLAGFGAAAMAVLLLSVVPARPAEELDLLRELLDIPGVAGHEERVRTYLEGRLPAWARDAAEVDALGNLVVTIGAGEPHLLLVAHMDETGYAVTHIEADGSLRVWKIGGFYDSLYRGQPVRIHTSRGAVNGVVAIPSTHLQSSRGPLPAYSTEDVLIDVGTRSRSETEALGIRKLDSITIPKQLHELAGTRWAARSMDDRFGCAAQVAVAHRIDPVDIEGTLTLAWVVQEEVGLRGAEALASVLTPDFVLPIDSYVSSDSPLERSRRLGYARLGDGPVIRALDHSNITPPRLVRSTLDFAARKGIPLQFGATGGGNDGSVFRNPRSVVMPLSIPIRYSHSAIETIDHRDLSHLVDLLEALATDHSWM